MNYYCSGAIDSVTFQKRGILLLANDIEDAKKRYNECLKRHNLLPDANDSDMVIHGNTEYLFHDFPYVEIELKKYHSALI